MITEIRATPVIIFTVMRWEVVAVWVAVTLLKEEEEGDASDFFLLVRLVGDEKDKSTSRDLITTSFASVSCKFGFRQYKQQCFWVFLKPGS